MKTDITIPSSVYQAAENELDAIEIIQEFSIWDIASDEALKRFEEELEKICDM